MISSYRVRNLRNRGSSAAAIILICEQLETRVEVSEGIFTTRRTTIDRLNNLVAPVAETSSVPAFARAEPPVERIGALAGLDFDELGDDGEPFGFGKAGDSRSLSLDTQP
jgi:hypothetical protein